MFILPNHPCLINGQLTVREEGGAESNSGHAVVICGQHGEPIKPLSIPDRGVSLGVHATFLLEVGIHIVECKQRRGEGTVVVYRVDNPKSSTEPECLEWHEVCRYQEGVDDILDEFKAAAQAAWDKAGHYHCREPHYINAPVTAEEPRRRGW